MKGINPYINFKGSAASAMEAYKEIFGGDLSVLPMSASPGGDALPPDIQSKIMHSHLAGSDFNLMGTDGQCPDGESQAPNSEPCLSIALTCSSYEEIEGYYGKLSEGGSIFCPLGPAFWGGHFAMVTDRFGVTWLMTCEA